MNNDTNHDPAFGEQCRVCGDRIGAEEGREIIEGDGTLGYAHANCV